MLSALVPACGLNTYGLADEATRTATGSMTQATLTSGPANSSTDDSESTVVPTTSGDSNASTGMTAPATTGPAQNPLMVNCGQPPIGAKAAQYSHQPSAAGGVPDYSWSAMGLPAGLTINASSGEIAGIPETTGDFVFELSVTDNEGVMAQTNCPSVTINAQLGVDLDAIGGPCLVGNESITDYLMGGDGSAIDCVAPQNIGDGVLPDGITVDKSSCEIKGAITETRYGTWAWIVRARQSGVDVYAPYCATQDKQTATAYKIVGSHSGKQDNELEPLTLPINIADPLRLDGDADPLFLVDKGVCGQPCWFRVIAKVSFSPFGTGACNLDKDTCFGECPLIADANEPDGDTEIGCSLGNASFLHELWAKGDPPPNGFANRPFILQWSIDYCISNVQADCVDEAAVLANGGGTNLEFPVIVRPQP